MIVVKARCESEELLKFRSLHLRMVLSPKDANYYSNLEKGFEGECKFDQLVEQHLSDDWLAVNDLLLECNNTIFQIDSLLIGSNIIILNEIKYYDGDYLIKDGKWHRASGKEVNDPVEQLNRCESLFRRFLQSLGFTLPIEARLVFNNPEFYLYQVPLNLPIIFPSQLNRYVNKLNMKSATLNDRQYKLAGKLVSLHIKKSPITRVPTYTNEILIKGIICRFGHAFMSVHSKAALVCSVCGCKETINSAVLRSVEEYKMLFPERIITTLLIHEWCKIISQKTIRRLLMENFKYQGHGKSAHFVE